MTTITHSDRQGRISYQACLLGLFTLGAALLLALGNIATHDAIEQRRTDDLMASLNQVIPEHIHDNDLLADTMSLKLTSGRTLSVYRATRNGIVTSVALPITGQGYGGDIDMILGLNTSGEILGARVLSHAETPGLGDKIELRRDDWILGFNGLSLGNPPPERWAVKKDGGDIDQFTGATITPRAVVRAIRQGLEQFNANRSRLLAPPAVDK